MDLGLKGKRPLYALHHADLALRAPGFGARRADVIINGRDVRLKAAVAEISCKAAVSPLSLGPQHTNRP